MAKSIISQVHGFGRTYGPSIGTQFAPSRGEYPKNGLPGVPIEFKEAALQRNTTSLLELCAAMAWNG